MFDKRLLILLCFMLNSGCFLFGPPYKKPCIDVPKKWPYENTAKVVDLPEMTWWKQFHSIELNELIQRALLTNNTIKKSITNIEFARSQLNEVKLNWIPNLTVLSGFSQFPILGNPGSVVIAYPLYIINILQLYKQQKSAQALYEANIYASACARLVVIAQVAGSFFTLIAQNETIYLYNKLLKDYHAYLQLAKSQYSHGLTSQDQVDQINSQIKQIQSQIDVTKYNIVVSKNALHYLLNENPGNINIKTSFKHLNSDALVPGNLPANVLTIRPDIREAESLLKAANADIGAVSASLLPTITVGAYLGKGSSIKGSIDLFEAYFNTPVVDLPIFAQISASKARYKTLYINYIDTVRQALRDVSNDLAAYAAYAHQLNNNISALKDEQRHCHLATQRYRHGVSDRMAVIQCTIKLDQFNLMINQNKLEKIVALVTLYQDLAGGYHGA